MMWAVMSASPHSLLLANVSHTLRCYIQGETGSWVAVSGCSVHRKRRGLTATNGMSHRCDPRRLKPDAQEKGRE